MALAAATASWSGSSGAAEPWSPAPQDPLQTTSFVSLGTGLGATTLGAVLLGTAPRDVDCGRVAGCLPAQTDDGRRAGASMLIGGGLGLAAVGAVGAGKTWATPLAPGERRDVPAAATAGLILTSLAGASLGAGIGLSASGNHGAFEEAVPLFVTSGLFASVSLPLLVTGGSVEDEDERVQERLDDVAAERARAERKAERMRMARDKKEREHRASLIETEMKSPVAVGVGVGVAVTGVAGGIALFINASNAPPSSGFMDMSGLGHAVGFGVAGAGAIGFGFGVGIPLMVLGAKQVPREEQPSRYGARNRGAQRVEEPAPRHAEPHEGREVRSRARAASFQLTSLTVGAGSAHATWSF